MTDETHEKEEVLQQLNSASKAIIEKIDSSTEKLTEESAALEAVTEELDKVVDEATAQM